MKQLVLKKPLIYFPKMGIKLKTTANQMQKREASERKHTQQSFIFISVHGCPTYSQKPCCFSRIKKLFGSNTLYHRTRRLYFQSLCLSFVLPSFCLIRFVPTRFTAVKCGKFVGNKWYSAPLTTLFILHNFISNISKFTLLVP